MTGTPRWAVGENSFDTCKPGAEVVPVMVRVETAGEIPMVR